MMLAMSVLWNTDFYAYFDGETLCGFTYQATVGNITVLLFFAVDEKLRSKGYGSAILAKLEEAYPKNQIVITIEPIDENAPDIETRRRRKKFYLGNGWKETGYYISFGGKQEILFKNGEFTKGGLRLFFMLYSNFTMYPKIWKK